MSVDLTTGNNAARGSILAENKFSIPGSYVVPNYGSDWVFDSSTVISACSNYDGSPGVGCIVQNLKLMYLTPLQAITMPSGNISNVQTIQSSYLELLDLLIGDYKLDEKGGTSLQNSQKGSGALGSASLCNLPFDELVH